jgi:class 3 adenylate cyclase
MTDSQVGVSRDTCPACGSEQQASAAFCSACGTSLRRDAKRHVDESEERRVVTVLFADLANSTALGERLDPEDMRALQTELFDLVNGQVELHGGVTESTSAMRSSRSSERRRRTRTWSSKARSHGYPGKPSRPRASSARPPRSSRHSAVTTTPRCVTLDAAAAFEDAGDVENARLARTRAAAVLGPLGCVYPF